MKTLVFSSLMAALVLIPGQTPVPGDRAQKTDEKPTAQKIDGQWTVVYAEMGGKKQADKTFTAVAIKDNVLHCKHDGKDKAWRLQFGPNQTVKVTAVEGGPALKGTTENPGMISQMQTGVYIASSEYLSFALNRLTTDTKPPKGIGGPRADQPPADDSPQNPAGVTGASDSMGPTGSGFVLILRREAPTK
jgi:hypothetical protein